MTRGSERVLWTAAFTGSIAVHAALAAALALAPAGQEETERPETEIVFQPLPQAAPDNPQRAEAFAALAPAGEQASAFARELGEASQPQAAEMAAVPPADSATADAVPVDEVVETPDDIAVAAVASEPPQAAVEAASPAAAPPAVETREAVTASGGPVEAAPVPAGPEMVADPAERPERPAADVATGDIAAAVGAGGDTALIALDAGAVALPAAPRAVVAVAPVDESPVGFSAGSGVAAGIVAPGSSAAASPGPVHPDAARVTGTASPVFAGETAVAASAPPAAAPPSAAVAVDAAPAGPVASPAPAVPVSPAAPPAVAVTPGEQAVAAVRPPDAPAVVAPRQSPAQAYAVLLEAIAGESGGGGCFMALASAEGDEIGVDGFAAERDRLDRFGRSLGDAIEAPLDMRRHAVSTPQCAALAFAGGLVSYPEPALSVELEAAVIASGGEMAGTVRNIARPWFYLLVIDDAGRVQEIDRDRLSASAPGTMSFRVPLTLMDDAPETVQLLLAIASDEILEMVWLREGQQADVYFDDLRAEIVASGGGVDFGIAPFMLR